MTIKKDFDRQRRFPAPPPRARCRGMAKTPTVETETPKPTYAELKAKKAAIEGERSTLVDRIAKLPKPIVEYLEHSQRAVRRAAVEKLNGTAAPFLASEIDRKDIAELRFDLHVLTDAIVVLDGLMATVQREEARQRVESRAADWRDAMREIALSLIALERALQTRDALSREIRAGEPLAGQGYTFAGRLVGACQAKSFLEKAVLEGWLSRTEFEEEMRRANSA